MPLEVAQAAREQAKELTFSDAAKVELRYMPDPAVHAANRIFDEA